MSAQKHLGMQSVAFANPPRIAATATIAGDVEGAGPLGNYFDLILEDDTWGEKSWEKAECKMFETSVRMAMDKLALNTGDIDCLLGGDLLNQIVSASYAARGLSIPFLGLYGACSTMAQSLLVGSMLIDGGFVGRAACTVSSHFSTAERQFRLPLEMGSQCPPSAQRTVTGSACAIITNDASGANLPGYTVIGDGKVLAQSGCPYAVFVTHGTLGKVVDMGVTDANNMGAAMAPSAAETILAHLNDTGRNAEFYDLIVTGDLGLHGGTLLQELLNDRGIDLSGRYLDCGVAVFSQDQDVNSGGSGCGCSAITLCGYLLKQMILGVYEHILFLSTGALMNPGVLQQGESIPGIAHAVALERRNV